VGAARRTRAPRSGLNTARSAHCSFMRPRGWTFLDRELYLPRNWATDKPQLARQMLTRALAAGVPCGWVTGETVYGSNWCGTRWLTHLLAQERRQGSSGLLAPAGALSPWYGLWARGRGGQGPSIGARHSGHRRCPWHPTSAGRQRGGSYRPPALGNACPGMETAEDERQRPRRGQSASATPERPP
jgi:hypothetical protein